MIAVALGAASDFEVSVLEGIRSVAGNWDLVVLTGGYETPLRRLASTGELRGAIGDFVSDTWVDELRSANVCIVQIAAGSALKKATNVGVDYFHAGVAAVDALMRNGVQHMAMAGAGGQHASREFERGARSQWVTSQRQLSCTSASSPPLLQSWITDLPKPCGILCISDRMARIVVTSAKIAGYQVPGEITVIGMGNQRMESVFAGIPLSSFELPARQIGQAAALAMETMLGKPRKKRPPDVFLPARLIERESSLRTPDGAGRAIAYISANLAAPICVDDLARIAGMSRRSLEIAMRRDHGCSPAELMATIREQEAHRLLKSTDLSIEQIGVLCGYPEPGRFSTAFKRWTNRTPREFRQHNTKKIRSRSHSPNVRQ